MKLKNVILENFPEATAGHNSFVIRLVFTSETISFSLREKMTVTDVVKAILQVCARVANLIND